MGDTKYFKMEDTLELGPFTFTVIGFTCIIQQECKIFNTPLFVQVDEIRLFTVNGVFIIPEEVDDFFQVQPDSLLADVTLNLENFVKSYYL